MKKKALLLSIALILSMVFIGCGQKKPEDMAEDTPWNHGYQAIMETEDGYYMNYSCADYNRSGPDSMGVDMEPWDGCSLYYYEKESGVDILLCNKPECQHNGGDSCEATYRWIKTINTALYEGSLYIYGMDKEGQMVSLNLYRAALDGSAIDKVGTVIQAENLRDETMYHPSGGRENCFFIHKGYAYIPYYLRFGQASKTFMGGGICRMNILTGETENIYTMENVSSGLPLLDAGIGDYIYYHKCLSAGGIAGKGYRYVISENRVEELTTYHPDYPENKASASYIAFSEDRNYSYGFTQEDSKLILIPFDAETGQRLMGEEFHVDMKINPIENDFHVVCYEDKLMITNREKVLWYSKEGEKLAELGIPFEGQGQDSWNDEFLVRINNDKLYLLHRTTVKYQEARGYDVYSCELSELLEGKGEWQKAFVIKDKLTREKEKCEKEKAD